VTKDISKAQKVYARSSWNREQFLEAVKQDNPNILVGTSTVLRTLTEDIVPAMVGGKEDQSSFRSPT
jgi:Malic enzyme, NAD binding domain.